MTRWHFPREDVARLRDLAARQRDASRLPIMEERAREWTRHNDLVPGRPMIHVEFGTFRNDLMPPLLCRDPMARQLEDQILSNLVNHERIDDDRVVPKTLDIAWWVRRILFDQPVSAVHAHDEQGRETLGHQFIHPIRNLEEDLPRLRPSRREVDRESTLAWKDFVENLLGDLLPVRLAQGSLYASPTGDVVRLMGMEAMFMAMVDTPDLFLALMDRVTQEYVDDFRWLEAEGLLLPNNGNDWLAQGSFGFTRSLPDGPPEPGVPLRTRDLWGYLDSQETVGVSPEDFAAFILPGYLRIAAFYGLLSYGCCEPVHPIWDSSLVRLPRMRKVSISAWCDEAFMGDRLRGSGVIYLRKPSPNFIGVGRDLDEEGYRAHIRKTLAAARGCQLEFAFRDIYTLCGDPEKPKRAVAILREEIQRHWEG